MNFYYFKQTFQRLKALHCCAGYCFSYFVRPAISAFIFSISNPRMSFSAFPCFRAFTRASLAFHSCFRASFCKDLAAFSFPKASSRAALLLQGFPKLSSLRIHYLWNKSVRVGCTQTTASFLLWTRGVLCSLLKFVLTKYQSKQLCNDYKTHRTEFYKCYQKHISTDN